MRSNDPRIREAKEILAKLAEAASDDEQRALKVRFYSLSDEIFPEAATLHQNYRRLEDPERRQLKKLYVRRVHELWCESESRGAPANAAAVERSLATKSSATRQDSRKSLSYRSAKKPQRQTVAVCTINARGGFFRRVLSGAALMPSQWRLEHFESTGKAVTLHLGDGATHRIISSDIYGFAGVNIDGFRFITIVLPNADPIKLYVDTLRISENEWEYIYRVLNLREARIENRQSFVGHTPNLLVQILGSRWASRKKQRLIRFEANKDVITLWLGDGTCHRLRNGSFDVSYTVMRYSSVRTLYVAPLNGRKFSLFENGMYYTDVEWDIMLSHMHAHPAKSLSWIRVFARAISWFSGKPDWMGDGAYVQYHAPPPNAPPIPASLGVAAKIKPRRKWVEAFGVAAAGLLLVLYLAFRVFDVHERFENRPAVKAPIYYELLKARENAVHDAADAPMRNNPNAP